MARPTILTEELGSAIATYVREGNYLETAAALAGIDARTVRAWIRKGVRDPSGQFGPFAQAVKAAEAHAEASAVQRIREAAQSNWTAAAWYLERKFPMRWGRWDRVTDDPRPTDRKALKAMRSKDVRDLLDAAAQKIELACDASSNGGEA